VGVGRGRAVIVLTHQWTSGWGVRASNLFAKSRGVLVSVVVVVKSFLLRQRCGHGKGLQYGKLQELLPEELS
jgi:hypothetical protein